MTLVIRARAGVRVVEGRWGGVAWPLTWRLEAEGEAPLTRPRLETVHLLRYWSPRGHPLPAGAGRGKTFPLRVATRTGSLLGHAVSSLAPLLRGEGGRRAALWRR